MLIQQRESYVTVEQEHILQIQKNVCLFRFKMTIYDTPWNSQHFKHHTPRPRLRIILLTKMFVKCFDLWFECYFGAKLRTLHVRRAQIRLEHLEMLKGRKRHYITLYCTIEIDEQHNFFHIYIHLEDDVDRNHSIQECDRIE